MSNRKANVNIKEVQAHMSQFDGGRYVLESVVGAGSYGIVLQGKDTLTGKPCAIKRVAPEIFKDVLLAKRILREIKMLAHFDHENIIGLQNILNPGTPDFDAIYIVMDVMETDLKAILKSGQAITEQHIQFFLYQILRGLDCVHKSGILHRDLTPSNILLNTDCNLKLCDFGLAKEHLNADMELTDYVVMRWYRAPELVMEEKHYGTAVDVWACGCILGEMFHKNRAIFPGKDRINQLDVILEIIGTPGEEDISSIGSGAAQKYLKRRPHQAGVDFKKYFQTPEKLPIGDDAADLLKKMLAFNPENRINVHEALNHPYFTELHDPEDEAACQPPPFVFNDEELEKNLGKVKQAIFETITQITAKSNTSGQTPQEVTVPQSPALNPTNDADVPRTAMQNDREGEEIGGEGEWHED